MANDWVVIEHKNGETYGVRENDLDKALYPDGEGGLRSYLAAGFKAVRYQDGRKYEAPRPRPAARGGKAKDDD